MKVNTKLNVKATRRKIKCGREMTPADRALFRLSAKAGGPLNAKFEPMSIHGPSLQPNPYNYTNGCPE
jgi:hypothetical protein